MTPAVRPKANWRTKWDLDRKTYKRRNGNERTFRRIKGCRRIFTRSEKLDTMYAAFDCFTLIVEMIKRQHVLMDAAKQVEPRHSEVTALEADEAA